MAVVLSLYYYLMDIQMKMVDVVTVLVMKVLVQLAKIEEFTKVML